MTLGHRGRYNKYTTRDKQAILSLFKRGHGAPAISKMLGFPKSTVGCHIQNAKLSRPCPKYTEEYKRSIVGLYEKGLAAHAIAKKRNRPSVTTILRWANKAGALRIAPTSKRYTKDIKERAKELYLNGKSVQEIGKEINVHFVTVAYWMRKKYAVTRPLNNNGANNPNWKGGVNPLYHKIRNSPEVLQWRLGVMAQDHYTCQHCGCAGGELHVHHILSFIKHKALRTNIGNGITLCKSCHRKVHRKAKVGA